MCQFVRWVQYTSSSGRNPTKDSVQTIAFCRQRGSSAVGGGRTENSCEGIDPDNSSENLGNEGANDMAIYKRGRIYWFNLWWRGQHIHRSTRQGNPRVARQIEAAYRTDLAKDEVGIVERKPAPGFFAAMRNFLAWSKEQHRSTPRRIVVTSSAAARY
jgi:hypothetical protein